MHTHDNVFTDLMVRGSAAQKAKVSQIESYTMAEHTCNTSVNTLTHSPRWGMQGSLASSMCALSIFLGGIIIVHVCTYVQVQMHTVAKECSRQYIHVYVKYIHMIIQLFISMVCCWLMTSPPTPPPTSCHLLIEAHRDAQRWSCPS